MLVWKVINKSLKKIKRLFNLKNVDKPLHEDGTTNLMNQCKIGNHSEVKLWLDKGAKPNLSNHRGETPLFFACKNEELDEVFKISKLLLKKKADPNNKDQRGVTPLLIACKNGNVRLVKLLLENNASPDLSDNKGETPLYLACKNKNFNILELLIEHNVNLDLTNSFGETILHYLAYRPIPGMTDFFISKGANPDFANEQGETPLHVAVSVSHNDVAKSLINKVTNINALDNDGISPLLKAVQSNNSQIVELLLERGADPNIADGEGRTSLLSAVNLGNIDIFEALLLTDNINLDAKDVYGRNAISYAVSYEDTKMVELLIANKVDLYAADNHGRTPLWYAIQSDNYEVLKLLLEHVSDVPDKFGRTLLWHAVESQKEEVVKLLLDENKNSVTHGKIVIDAPDMDGVTPLHLACHNGDLNIVKLLFDNNTNPNLTDKSARSLLWYAVKSKVIEIVKLLLARNYNPNVLNKMAANTPDKVGVTPLYLACESGDIDMVKLLLENKANPNFTDNDGITPIWIASKYGFDDIIDELVDEKANVEASPQYGRYAGVTPLMICAYNNHMETCIKLIKYGAIYTAIIPDGPDKGKSILSILAFNIINNISEIKHIKIEDVRSLIQHKLNMRIDDDSLLSAMQKYASAWFESLDGCNSVKPIDNKLDFKELYSIYGEGSTIIRKFNVDGSFYSQVDTLMQQYASLYNKLNNMEGSGENFLSFARYFRREGAYDIFAEQEGPFFEIMKKQLEEIYLYLLDANSDKQKIFLDEMSTQLVMCGPGIFNSIVQYHAELQQGDITIEVAKYRNSLIREVFVKVADQLGAGAGMDIHVLAHVMNTAQRECYEPLGGVVQLAHEDRFITGIVRDIELENINVEKELENIFEKKYNLNQVLNYLEEQIVEDFSEVLNISHDKEIKNMDSYLGESRNKINIICKKYEIDDEKIFEPDYDDYTKAKIDVDSIKIGLLNNLFKTHILKTHEVKMGSWDVVKYFGVSGKLYRCDKDGDVSEMSKGFMMKIFHKVIAGTAVVSDNAQMFLYIIPMLVDDQLISKKQAAEYLFKLYKLSKKSTTQGKDYINFAKQIASSYKEKSDVLPHKRAFDNNNRIAAQVSRTEEELKDVSKNKKDIN